MIEIGGLAGTLLLLVPFAVLLLTVVSSVRRKTKTNLKTAVPAEAVSEPVAAQRYVLTAVGGGGAGVDARGDAPVAKPSAEHWLDQIRLAEERNDAAALPALYLALGQEEIARGEAEDGAGHLRSCIRHAARSRNAAVEAEARLELAELAREAGDLTTACEHWQIARSLFHKLARTHDVSVTEDRMRHHGCPTDWVLTDF
ncbi:hypothetical protein W911_12725 [Hyphomicrobium nitrativorans NL23]|uniref:Uncharacterized protein n=1 Tax=Hyphomicrobium nitrativorans NL23 TaxID=1029756 RepID=V5SHA9_9HYPH|nr:hypothetical protein [Hyphomicrobium nitrativorans]AHB50271.1 hypothetical protein W911_12725 [Hyphomicrobium nitrativorans NL23]